MPSKPPARRSKFPYSLALHPKTGAHPELKRRFQRRFRKWMRLRIPPKNIPPFLGKADFGTFSIEKTNQWTYGDHSPSGGGVSNDLPRDTRRQPHLVLKDVHGTPRYTLGYVPDLAREHRRVTIFSIQGERTQYVPNPDFGKPHSPFMMQERWTFSDASERAATRRLKKSLGGVFPSEFLLAWFLWENRAEIRNGLRVQLRVSRKRMNAYGPLIDRYFSKPPEYKDKGNVVFLFPLNVKKRRVKEILGVE